MFNLIVKYLLFKEEIVSKSQLIKSSRVPRKALVHTNGDPVFVPN